MIFLSSVSSLLCCLSLVASIPLAARREFDAAAFFVAFAIYFDNQAHRFINTADKAAAQQKDNAHE